jgi:glycosyltransferase involved in cell wall biosynthesis
VRVLLVSSHGADSTYGGAERYVRDLALGLRARGHETTVLSAFPPRDCAGLVTYVLHSSDWRDDPLRRFRNHAGDVVSAPWRRFGAIVAEVRADLVHTSNLPGIGSGFWEVSRRNGIPVVHTLHDYHLLCPRTTLTRRDGTPCEPSPALCGLRTRRLARWGGAVRELVAGSQQLLERHRGLFPRVHESVIRLPLVPVVEGGPAPPRSSPTTLGYLGALTPVKGIGLLLEATPALADQGIELRIAGDGPLRELVGSAGVRYVGRVEGSAKEDFLTSCDVGIVPSLWEEPSGPPYVVCEWLASGRPVLVTRRGGLRETTRYGGVVPFEASRSGLVDGATRLCQPDEWRHVLAAMPTVDGDSDFQRWIDEHEAVYEAAVERDAAKAPAASRSAG